MDYRYEKNYAVDFHNQRIAFIILNKNIEFLPLRTNMSHYEYCKTKGMSKDEFNKITRGYYLDGNLVFYKDNFIYDDELIKEALNYVNEISSKIGISEFNIYFGEIPEKYFELDYYYGKYVNGIIMKG